MYSFISYILANTTIHKAYYGVGKYYSQSGGIELNGEQNHFLRCVDISTENMNSTAKGPAATVATATAKSQVATYLRQRAHPQKPHVGNLASMTYNLTST